MIYMVHTIPTLGIWARAVIQGAQYYNYYSRLRKVGIWSSII